MKKHFLIALGLFSIHLTLAIILPEWSIVFISFFILSVFLYIIKLKWDILSVEEQKSKRNSEQMIYLQRNVESYHQLLNIFKLNSTVPYTGGWAASSDFLHLIVSKVLSEKPEKLIECGSGLSTLYIAYSLKRNNKGHLISLDHDPKYAAQTEELLREHGLSEFVTVKTCELVSHEINGKPYKWYDYNPGKERFDLISVDGPPYSTNALARYPAGPILLNSTNDNAVVIIDDGKRPDELAMIKKWTAELDHWSFNYIDLEKGAYLGIKSNESSH